MPDPQVGEPDMGLRTLTPMGGLLQYNYSPVCGSPTWRVWDLIILQVCPSYLSHCSSLCVWLQEIFSYRFQVSFPFFLSFSLFFFLSFYFFLSMVILEIVVILVCWWAASSGPFYSASLATLFHPTSFWLETMPPKLIFLIKWKHTKFLKQHECGTYMYILNSVFWDRYVAIPTRKITFIDDSYRYSKLE